MSKRITIEIDGRECIGLDIGDVWSHYHVEGPCGEEVASGKVKTTQRGLKGLFGSKEPCRIALEVGTHSPWISALLERLGHEVVVANAQRVALVSKNQRKGDKADAKFLAWLLRAEPRLLFPIRHRGLQARAHLEVIRSRDLLVRTRTALISHIRGVVKSVGGRIPTDIGADTFHRRAKEFIPEVLHPQLLDVLQLIAHQSSMIRERDREIERLCAEVYPETARLRQVNRVGAITALAYVLIVDDPHRFLRRRDVGAYFGLVPRRRASGGSDPELSITKAGDALMRRLLVQCAQQQLGHFGKDSDLRRWGLALAARGGKNAKKRAVTAVARKLSVLLLALWITETDYVPCKEQEEQKAA